MSRTAYSSAASVALILRSVRCSVLITSSSRRMLTCWTRGSRQNRSTASRTAACWVARQFPRRISPASPSAPLSPYQAMTYRSVTFAASPSRRPLIRPDRISRNQTHPDRANASERPRREPDQAPDPEQLDHEQQQEEAPVAGVVRQTPHDGPGRPVEVAVAKPVPADGSHAGRDDHARQTENGRAILRA